MWRRRSERSHPLLPNTLEAHVALGTNQLYRVHCVVAAAFGTNGGDKSPEAEAGLLSDVALPRARSHRRSIGLTRARYLDLAVETKTEKIVNTGRVPFALHAKAE